MLGVEWVVVGGAAVLAKTQRNERQLGMGKHCARNVASL
jgi:hypothetical protein